MRPLWGSILEGGAGGSDQALSKDAQRVPWVFTGHLVCFSCPIRLSLPVVQMKRGPCQDSQPPREGPGRGEEWAQGRGAQWVFPLLGSSHHPTTTHRRTGIEVGNKVAWLK